MSSIKDYKIGMTVYGKITGIKPYGAFVKFDDGITGLIHISEISHQYVKNITDFLNLGDTIYVEVLEVDDELSHLKLSIKNINYKPTNIKKYKKIVETKTGFKTLAYKLPKWIENSLQSIKKN